MKVMFVMRGVSGSGKSTVARKLADKFDAVIASQDDYFMEDGVYHFNYLKLSEAAMYCYDTAFQAVMEGRSVVVDNMNLLKSYYSPYVMMAQHQGYKVFLVQPDFLQPIENISEVDEELIMTLAHRNTHGVTQLSLARMFKAYEAPESFDPPTLKWKEGEEFEIPDLTE